MTVAKLKNTISPLRILIALLIPAALYFLAVHAFPRLNYSREAYGEYYWFRAPWLLVHAIAGIFATLSGPVQFIPSLRNKHLRLHRNLGKLYMLAIGIAAITAVYLAFTSAITQWYTFGLVAGASIWLYTGTMAYVHIKNRRTRQHQHMMIRNYIVTLFFIIFFGIYDVLVATGTDPYNGTMLSVLPWACLFIPLVITEYFLTAKKR